MVEENEKSSITVNLWGNDRFRNLLLAYSLTVLVDSVVFMTLLKWIEIESGKQYLFTAFYICFYLPAALFSFAIGTWVEKRTLQKVMQYSEIARIVLIPIAILAINKDWLVCVFVYAMLESSISLFFLPASDALLPRIVQKKDRAAANSYLKMMFILMHTIGFMAAGVLIKMTVKFDIIFVLSGFLLVISILCVRRIKPLVKQTELEKPFSEMFKEGVAYLNEQKNIRYLILMLAGAWVVASSIDLVIIAFLTGVAKTGTENFSFIAASTFMGMVVGAIGAPNLYYKWERKWVFIFPLFVYGLVIQSMNLFHDWIMLLPFFFVGGVVLGLFEVYFTTFLQDETQPEFLARVFSIHTMILSSGPLFGFIIIGFIMEHYSINIVIHTISIFLLMLGVVSLWFFPKVKKGIKEERESAS